MSNKGRGIVIMILAIILAMIFVYIGIVNAAPKAVNIGEFVNIDRLGPRDDKIMIVRINDLENPFISIYVTQVKSGEWTALADPSNSSISCRLTGIIPVDEDGKQIINKATNLNIGSFRKSIGSKVMKIARFYDKGQNVLVYVVYTTKMFDGSSKHSLSVVPLN
jgi:CreA protein